MTTWGLCATIKAPTPDILHFAAFHLEAGAHRLYIYLDDDNREVFAHLDAHPKIRATLCDAERWQGKRPKKHQVRQSRNATHAYARRVEVDWLVHIDVDEFLISDRPIADVLAAIAPKDRVSRVRPMEQLAGQGTAFKAFIPPGADRARIVADLYPHYAPDLRTGFLSHVAGKVFVRTGLPNVEVRIHNVFQNGAPLKGPEDTTGLSLAHCHAPSWEDWRAAYRYRHAHGAYRTDLGPADRPSLHDLLARIEHDGGDTGLRLFFDTVCADTPAHRAILSRHGLLRHAKTDLNATIQAHFPAFTA